MPSKDDSHGMGEVRRVAVFRALALGDLVCAVPTLRALRRAWPAAEISLVGLPWAREFAAIFQQYLDHFIEFPGWPGLPEREPQLSRVPAFLAHVEEQKFDLAIQLHGAGTIVNSLVALFGARSTAGFYPPGYFCPDPRYFLPWPEEGLEIHRLLAVPRRLGIGNCSDALEWPVQEGDFERLDALLPHALDRRSPFVIVHPGASVPERRWGAENFAAAADFAAKRGFQIVLTGTAGERALVERVLNRLGQPAINLCGRTDLRTLGALVARAALVIANDTGISHVAAATQTPSVIISTGDNPARWAPIDTALHRVLCRAGGVEVDEVCDAAAHLLELTFQPELATA